MRVKDVFIAFCICFWPILSLADASLPSKDVTGSSDSELVGRLDGAFIVSYMSREFDEATFPLSALVRSDGKRDTHNNVRFSPDEKIDLEGQRTRIVYLNRAGVSSLEVVRSYEKELAQIGGEKIYSCKGDECGGDSADSSGSGGGLMSLSMFLWDEDEITERHASTGYCAQTMTISDQRYSLIHVPERAAYVSVQAYTLKRGTFCGKIIGRTVSIVEIIKEEELETNVVTVSADQMSSEISNVGKIALYGIQFDSGKDTLKPDSKTTLSQIAQLLNANSDMRLLIVGHTDSKGSYDFNLDLSQRRAGSVVRELIENFGVKRERLFSVGVSFASPVAANTTEEGRALNRRVELVNF